MTEPEEWRRIPNLPSCYEVSNLGRARNTKTGRLIGVGRKRGYPYLSYMIDGKQKYIKLHIAVAHTFDILGTGPSVLHRDDNKLNNSVENLYRGTQRENVDDMMRNGKHSSSGQTHCKRNHEFTEENTRRHTRKDGRVVRVCRTCKREAQRKDGSK